MAYEHQEYPRDLHKADGLTKRVNSDDEKSAALADGWQLQPVVNGVVIDFDEETPAEDAKPKGKKKPN
jgi:hypothetical protein